MSEEQTSTDAIVLSKPAARVVVRFRQRTIADTNNALALLEPGCSPVYYIPKRDIDVSTLVDSKTATFCPRKGHATHYIIVVDGRRSDDAAWEYLRPLADVAAIAGHLAFDEDRVDELSINETQRL